jgi:enoyl-CoA hydratase/carnithine racemase
MAEYKTIHYNIEKEIATITLKRPEVGNSLDYLTIKEIRDALEYSEKLSDVRAIVLKGDEKFFSTGIDLNYIAKLRAFGIEENKYDTEFSADLLLDIQRNSKLVVALVEGFALGFGWALAQSCDFVIASDRAIFGIPELKRGFLPLMAFSILINHIGQAKLKQLIYTAENITAQQAFELNLVYKIFPSDNFCLLAYEEIQKIIDRIAGGGIGVIKKLFVDANKMPLEPAIKFTARMLAHARGTQEYAIGIDSFFKQEILKW